jgi:hypothetical protein
MHLKDARTRTDTHLECFQNQALPDVQCRSAESRDIPLVRTLCLQIAKDGCEQPVEIRGALFSSNFGMHSAELSRRHLKSRPQEMPTPR